MLAAVADAADAAVIVAPERWRLLRQHGCTPSSQLCTVLSLQD
jgi:hypothetical protein